MLPARRLALALLLAAGCGGAPPAPSEVSRPAPPKPVKAALLPLREMRYVAADRDAKSVVVLQVHADGRVERPGKLAAHVDAGRVLCPDGLELLRVDAAGRVVFDEKLVAHLTRDGVFEIDPHYGSWSLTVRKSGDLALTTHAGTEVSHELRWEGFGPEARRTAALLSGFLTPAFGGRWCGEPTSAGATIPGTDVPDTADNRRVIEFCEQYRKALEARDTQALLALASPSYHDDAGTPTPEDDIDYASLEKSLSELMAASDAIRYEIRYRGVKRDGGTVLVDTTYSATYLLHGEARHVVRENQLALEAYRGSFRILSGM